MKKATVSNKANIAAAAGQPTDQRPFNQLWINSCYQQTLLPNAPWHKLEEEISHSLAQKVEKQFSQPQRKEMLMEVLGRHFVEKYLSHVQRNPEILEPSHMSANDKNRLRIDAQNWLNSQMYKAVKETGHGYLLTGIGPGEPPPTGSYAEFLRETFSVFTTGLDRELYKLDTKLKVGYWCKKSSVRYCLKATDIYKVPAPSRLKQAGTSESVGGKSVARQIKAPVFTVKTDPLPLWGPQSDTIGSAVVSLLLRDPRKFEVVAGRLHGRQLPGSLRSYLWADVLFKAERKKMKEVYVEKIVRERFAVSVSRGLTDLRINKPTQSPINGLIQNTVVETYSKTTSMIQYKQMEHIKETIRALNVLYVYDRSYEPYLVYWLFPIQLAFRSKEAMSDDKGEHILELAMYLDLLNSNCFPTWPHVFAMAEQVMMRLEKDDPQLHNHLRRIAPINAQVNPKEFLVQLLHQEREQAEALLQLTTTNTPRAPSSSTQFLADPTIFLRRWIGEGFVSVLDTPGVMYIWDQLFMQNWTETAIINVCLSLMELLRHKFMEAYDYITMKEVFLMEPCKLYTVDFQMAWIHLENGKPLLDINDQFNRQRPLSASSDVSVVLSDRDSPELGILKPCGIKNMRSCLTFPSSSIQKEPWLANIQGEDLRLNVGVYFGSVKLRSRLSHSLAVVTAKTKDSYGSFVLELEFPGEHYIYDMLDLSTYDVERELGAYPYVIIKLELFTIIYINSIQGPITLGWSRIPLYRHVNHRDNQGFSLIEGDVTVALHPGDIPESIIAAQPHTPSEEDRVEGTLLGYNCTFSAYVFDPNNEPSNRKVKPLKAEVIPAVAPLDTRVSKYVFAPLDTRVSKYVFALLDTRVSKYVFAPLDTRVSKYVFAPLDTRVSKDVVAPFDTRVSKYVFAPLDTRVSKYTDPLDEWIPYNPSAAKSDPKPTTNRDPFVLHIDSVRHLPDSATIIKVTGRILRAGNITNLQDILAIPELDSSARSPKFNFNMLVNEGQQIADPELLLFLRVYTHDLETNTTVVVGSCLVRVFTPGKKKGEGYLCVGGHELRLYSGMPNTKDGLNQINATDLDSNPVLPGCTLLLRLLPQSNHPVPAPKYSSGYYKSEKSKPTASELRLYASYAADNKRSVRDVITKLQHFENSPYKDGSDIQLTKWIVDKLDIKKQQGVNKAAANLALHRCIRYRVKVGLNVHIKSAVGLPDGLHIQCFARLAPGKQAKYQTASEAGHGKEEQFITTKLSPTSQLTAPVWEDGHKELHPCYDNNTCLIIQLIGLNVVYKPKADHKTAGTVHQPDGRPLEINAQELIGWAVVPLFEGNAAKSGLHMLPVLTHSPSEQTVEELSEKSAGQVLRTLTGSKLNGASLQVQIWDAHFSFNELPQQEVHKSLLDLLGNPDGQTVRTKANSQTVQDFVLSMCDEKDRKQGLQGVTLNKEVTFFSETMAKTFGNLMINYCHKHGLNPL
ncbi:unnamed protein product [Lymnaea stagnalis]|uniref:Uncharacterized protein n=1 Tax=Lymnaea stagnalis TaxID=6523 RepID=A0AAV2IQY2_LYMST